jgi:hypothetical protein
MTVSTFFHNKVYDQFVKCISEKNHSLLFMHNIVNCSMITLPLHTPPHKKKEKEITITLTAYLIKMLDVMKTFDQVSVAKCLYRVNDTSGPPLRDHIIIQMEDQFEISIINGQC